MKLRKQLETLLVLMVLVGGLHIAASAQSVNAREDRIVGVWDVQVMVHNCANGAVVGGFRGLHKYELGGTVQVVPSTNPAALSPHVGVWSLVEKDTYKMTFKMFRFDPTGNNIGWIVVHNDVAINEDATAYAGSGKAEVFDTSGNLVGASCPTFTGGRLE